MNTVVDSDFAEWLPWLADAPLFVDRPQIEALYDAVLAPRYRELQVVMTRQRVKELSGSVGAAVEGGLPRWFPWFKAEMELSASLDARKGNEEGEAYTFEAISTPSRQLVELALHYVANQTERIWYSRGELTDLPDKPHIQDVPRMLAVLDMPEKTKIVPMAAELSSGRVVTFFNELVEGLAGPGDTLPPKYPDDPEGNSDQAASYWQWFDQAWKPSKVLAVLEESIGTGGRPRWVDYRVPVLDGTHALHLHLVGHGEVDTGTYAYNLVKRGWKHGLRILGTLRSEPSVNVLAVYEK